MRNVNCILLVLVLLFGVEESFAQMNRRDIKRNNKRMSSFKGRKTNFSQEKTYSMAGLAISALNYYGDLAPKPNRFSTDISFTRPAIGLSLGHRFGARYSVFGTFMYGTLRGADVKSADVSDESNGVYRFQRNLSFRNRIKELSLIAYVDIFENYATYISRASWSPYVFAGVSVFHHNPQAQVPQFHVDGITEFANAGEWVDLQPLGTEGQYADLDETAVNKGIKPYKKIQVAIPFGVGARFRINEVLDLSADIGFRYLFTDYIDDVSANYVDLGVFEEDELAKAMSYRTGEVAAPTQTYVGSDGVSYNILAGYGAEAEENVRGNKDDKDIFMVTTLRLTYIIGKSFHRAKFR